MFAKSMIAASLVAFLIACMAVEAAPVVASAAGGVLLPERCQCTMGYNTLIPQSPTEGSHYVKDNVDDTQNVCVKVGQANGAVFNSTISKCVIGTQSGYDSFFDECANRFIMDPLGDLYNGIPFCFHDVPNLPPPQACICPDPLGVNTTAQTTYACTGPINNLGTMVGDKCVLPSQDNYRVFDTFCANKFRSAATCSDW